MPRAQGSTSTASEPQSLAGRPAGSPQLGGLTFHPFLNAADAHSQPCNPAPHPPEHPQLIPCSRRCQALSRIITPWPGRGNPVLSPAAPGPRFRTLPSILRPGFRSLSAPNNAALAEHLPRAAPAPADGLAGASCHCPERLRARGQKAQQSSPEESQRSPQCPIKQPAPSPTAGRGKGGGTPGTIMFKRAVE